MFALIKKIMPCLLFFELICYVMLVKDCMAEDNGFIGKQIGSYRIVAKLNCGSFGCVYRAQHTILTERIVAIKLMHNTHLHSEKDRDNFLREAQFLDKLKHPHILPIYDVSIDENTNRLYQVSEYASRGSLRDRLKLQPRRPLPTEEALSILTQIGKALDYAHQQIPTIVHRDLKPENVLFNAKGVALLADFGIATVLDTVSVQVIDASGTPPYMAPEQFEGNISKECDQYALGCIAYELFTGRRPFIASSYVAFLYKHVMEVPTPPTHYNPQLPEHIEQAILKAMAKQRGDRYSDISAFIGALHDVSASEGPILGTTQSKVSASRIPTPIRTRNLDPTQKTKKQWLDEGDAHYRAGRYEDALAAYDCAIQVDPDSASAHNSKGQALEQLGHFHEALLAFERSIIYGPEHADTWRNKGNALFLLERYEEALVAFERAIQLETDNTADYIRKGDTLWKLKHYEEALVAYEYAIKLKPTSASAHNGRGNALRDLNRAEESLAAFERANRLDPYNAEFHNNKGLALYQLKRYEESLAAHECAIKLDPSNVVAHSYKGNALWKLNRYEEALTAYECALQLDTNDPLVHNGKSYALWKLKRYEESLAAYERAIQLDANFASAYNGKGNALYYLKRSEEALAAYEKAIQLNPNDPAAHNGKGDALFLLDSYEEALASYEEALRLDNEYAPAYYGAGNVFFQLKRYKEALGACELAIQIEPGYAPAHHGKGNALRELKHCDEALVAYECAFDIDPDNALFYY